jgi:hypothetical protein
MREAPPGGSQVTLNWPLFKPDVMALAGHARWPALMVNAFSGALTGRLEVSAVLGLDLVGA